MNNEDKENYSEPFYKNKANMILLIIFSAVLVLAGLYMALSAFI